MSLPTGDKYVLALQNPSIAFRDPELKVAVVEAQKSGLPRPYSGAYTMTFHLLGKDEWAVRCFTREVPEVRQRYDAITRFLLSINDARFAKAELQFNGILVDSSLHDIIKMDWQTGDQLHVFVRRHINDRGVIKALADQIMLLGLRLEALGISHGDLQHGNVLVNPAGQLRLVDYDDMFLPELAGIGHSSGLGHKNYQHPGRKISHYGPNSDRFSIYVIYIALLALAESPALWQRFDGGDEKLLFGRDDFANPAQSTLFQELSTLPKLAVSIDKFAAICSSTYSAIPSLSDFLDGRFSFSPYLRTSQAKTTQAPYQTKSQAVSPPVQTPSSSQTSQLSGTRFATPTLASTSTQHVAAPAGAVSKGHHKKALPWRKLILLIGLLAVGISLERLQHLMHGSTKMTQTKKVYKPSKHVAPPNHSAAAAATLNRGPAAGKMSQPYTKLGEHSFDKGKISGSLSKSGPAHNIDVLPAHHATHSKKLFVPKLEARTLESNKPVYAGDDAAKLALHNGTQPHSLTDAAKTQAATGDVSPVPQSTAPLKRSLTDVADSVSESSAIEQRFPTSGPTPPIRRSLTDIAEASAAGVEDHGTFAGTVVSSDALHITISAGTVSRVFSLERPIDVAIGTKVQIDYEHSKVERINAFVGGAWRQLY